MKKILITGENSYIGTSFEKWISKYPDKYQADTISTFGDSWKEKDFSGYDAVFHVAGIAHADTGKVDDATKKLYYDVNQKLTIATAEKAKSDGVKQFIFMSSIIVYGDGNFEETRVITKATKPNPSGFYGDSKLQADVGIHKLQDNKFNVASIRPPMIYGKNSKGNYPRLAKLAQKLPIFPDFPNQRSMLHIDNLCEFTRLLIDNNESGIFYPQNKEYVCTTELVKLIAKSHGKNIRTTKLFNPLIGFLGKKSGLVNKVFGSLVYEKSLSDYYKWKYRVRDFEESIVITEGEL